MNNINIEPIAPHLGALVKISPTHLLDEGVAEACLQALNQYGVLLFPQISISDETQVAFSNQLGKMEAASNSAVDDTAAKELGIYPVTLDPTRHKYRDYIDANVNWHIDGTAYETLPRATTLKCEVPPSAGGDTEFANLFSAYDCLPEAKKQQFENLRIVHSVEAANRMMNANPLAEDLDRWRTTIPPREQPLVWAHSDGRKSLVIGSTADHIVGMSESDSKALIDELLEWCTREQFCYRHHWQQGDLAVWNTRGNLHCAHPYTEGSGRLMHRTTVMGS